MDVLVISHGFQDHYTASFSNGLAKLGVNVMLTRSVHLDPATLDPGVMSVDLGQNTGKEKSRLRKAFNFIRYHLGLMWLCLQRRQSTAHIIGLLRYEILLGILQGLFIRTVCRRYVLTVHNIVPHDNEKRYLKYVLYVVYRIPHVLMVHTTRMKEELVNEFGLRPEKIVIIQHGVNDIRFSDDAPRSEHRQRMGFSEEDFVLLFFGRIAPYKGLDILLEAFALLDEPHFKLLVVGAPINNEYGAEVNSLIAGHQFRDRIQSRLGWVDDKDIPPCFKCSDLLVLPYRHIDQSGVLFLSFSFGLPILASDVGSFRDYLRENDTGVVIENLRPDTLAAGIRSVCAARQSYKQDAIIAYGQTFAWESVLKPLQAYY